MIDHITSLEIVIALLVLLVEMILIDFQGCIQRDIRILEHKLVIPMDMINLLVATTFPIEVLDAINMVLSPNSLQSHIFLIMDHEANHLKQHIQVLNNFFQLYPHYGNYRPDLYTCHRTNDDDFESHFYSIWN